MLCPCTWHMCSSSASSHRSQRRLSTLEDNNEGRHLALATHHDTMTWPSPLRGQILLRSIRRVIKARALFKLSHDTAIASRFLHWLHTMPAVFGVIHLTQYGLNPFGRIPTVDPKGLLGGLMFEIRVLRASLSGSFECAVIPVLVRLTEEIVPLFFRSPPLLLHEVGIRRLSHNSFLPVSLLGNARSHRHIGPNIAKIRHHDFHPGPWVASNSIIPRVFLQSPSDVHLRSFLKVHLCRSCYLVPHFAVEPVGLIAIR
mmetsp:Transcript_17963/g.34072  ORF Transcript_17963/g.34072 Transcript_17963/m.34072 type:complete len:257 (-) Transcript_17963:422-1192(-)